MSFGIIKVCPLCGKEEIVVDGDIRLTYMKTEGICNECTGKLKRLIESYDELINAANADGCDGCKYLSKDEFEMPCVICKNRYKNMWTEE